MKPEDFDNLVKSIRQAGRIRRGQMKPSRVTEFAPANVKAVRRRLGLSQTQFARMIRGERCHAEKLGARQFG
jgi:putative transcriptional regulator